MKELNFNDKRFDWPDWGDGDLDEMDDIRINNPFANWDKVEIENQKTC